MSLGTAFRAFFAALSDSKRSAAIRAVLDSTPDDLQKLVDPADRQSEKSPSSPPAREAVATVKAVRSEALTLLSLLQRESRLVDLIQEPLDQYSDAQVGSAARPCLKQCHQALQRVFDLQPLLSEEEGTLIEVPRDCSPIKFQWIGASSSGAHANSIKQGRVVHPGWVARKCELPQWTGIPEEQFIVAPADIELP